MIFDLLFELFELTTASPAVSSPPATHKKGSSLTIFEQLQKVEQAAGIDNRHDLRDNYYSFLLIAFVKAGLFEVLVDILRDDVNTGGRVAEETENQKFIAARASILLGELLKLANRLLPSSICAKLQVIFGCMKDMKFWCSHFQSLPGLVVNAISFQLDVSPNIRSKCSSMLTTLYQHTKTPDDASPIVTSPFSRRKPVDKMEDVRRKIEVSVDAHRLQTKIQQTMVF